MSFSPALLGRLGTVCFVAMASVPVIVGCSSSGAGMKAPIRAAAEKKGACQASGGFCSALEGK